MAMQNRAAYRQDNGARHTWNQLRIKINGPDQDPIYEVQQVLAKAYGHRAILSPVMRSESYGRPSGYHAFVTITEDRI